MLNIRTNVSIDTDTARELAQWASARLASALGKPEGYVMVAVEPGVTMSFAGSPDPTAYLELKSIGLAESQTADLSQMLCAMMQEKLGVPQDRTYIEFADAPRKMFGWNGGTF